MATPKQTKAAKKNVRKAQKGAQQKRSLAHLPKATKTALGKQGAAVAQRRLGLAAHHRDGGAQLVAEARIEGAPVVVEPGELLPALLDLAGPDGDLRLQAAVGGGERRALGGDLLVHAVEGQGDALELGEALGRHGGDPPPDESEAFQISSTRAMSARSSGLSGVLAARPRRLHGICARSFENPLSISHEMARPRARSLGSLGQSLACGNSSATYSQMASDS